MNEQEAREKFPPNCPKCLWLGEVIGVVRCLGCTIEAGRLRDIERTEQMRRRSSIDINIIGNWIAQKSGSNVTDEWPVLALREIYGEWHALMVLGDEQPHWVALEGYRLRQVTTTKEKV